MMVNYRVEFSSKLFLISSAWSLNLYLYHPFIASWLHTIPAIGAHSVVYSIMVILLSYFVAGIIAYVQVTIKQLRSKRLASRSA